jgi:mRNA-degrading endonuclease RelE of RelBE toxin-antitoxin system
MEKNLEKILEKLSPERREKIEQKIFEDLRSPRKLTQLKYI